MSTQYEVITYEDTMVFNYSISPEEGEEQIEREIVLVWEDTLEKFFETYSSDKPYKIQTFASEREKNRFIDELDEKTEMIIDEVDEEISQKMKFSHVYTSPTYED